jgi:alkylated DNA repair protein (DNA oxidative demethylase)
VLVVSHPEQIEAGKRREPLTRLLMGEDVPEIRVIVGRLGEVDPEDFMTVRQGLERITQPLMSALWDHWAWTLGVKPEELKEYASAKWQKWRVPENLEPGTVREIRPGAFYLPGFQNLEKQKILLDECRPLEFSHNQREKRRGGGEIKKTKACFGRKINNHYEYETSPSVPPVPERWRRLASEIVAKVNAAGGNLPLLDADIGLVNAYPAGTGFDEHRDNDETEETFVAGVPVVSLNLGADADFMFEKVGDHPHTHGGVVRHVIKLRSGDAFVWGGPARLALHAVGNPQPKTGPLLDIARVGTVRASDPDTLRINITLRQLALRPPSQE